MELDDIVWGILGFLVFFIAYLSILGATKIIKKYYNSTKNKNDVDKEV